MGKPIGKFDFLRAARLRIIKLIDRKREEAEDYHRPELSREVVTAFVSNNRLSRPRFTIRLGLIAPLPLSIRIRNTVVFSLFLSPFFFFIPPSANLSYANAVGG